ncbi:MAG: acylneuraminate cytidylyltransferase family protein [Candidatus Competibacteraceae bacterium]|nr:acylneuraminate cytidylyltransferase family protein [Candidatus Competibacteraceae bacterium]
MAFEGLSVLAVVPARGGSKSIPRKNLAPVRGLSLIAHAAQVCRSLPWIDRAVLSSDDDEIMQEAARHGLEVPFRRPAELASDGATSVEMWRHAWLKMEEIAGRRFDVSILLEPTSPLRRPEDLERTVTTLCSGGHAAAATVSRTPAHYTPHKTLTVEPDGRIAFYLPEGSRHSLRQSIPAYYHRNGACYAVRRQTLVEGGTILEHDCAAVIIERPLVNIDEPLDLELAEFLLDRAARR